MTAAITLWTTAISPADGLVAGLDGAPLAPVACSPESRRWRRPS